MRRPDRRDVECVADRDAAGFLLLARSLLHHALRAIEWDAEQLGVTESQACMCAERASCSCVCAGRASCPYLGDDSHSTTVYYLLVPCQRKSGTYPGWVLAGWPSMGNSKSDARLTRCDAFAYTSTSIVDD